MVLRNRARVQTVHGPGVIGKSGLAGEREVVIPSDSSVS
jgi:hypothetical protein